ncbi:MAG TPA: hypothetical protein VD884_06390 [Ohtaekwangia sp.]|nr:hypothetical protein [Ohtaekwangia sp.]
MKTIKIITTFFIGAMVFMSACDPIEERDTLKNSFNPDHIELEVIQTADGKGNGLTLKMNTPGVIGYWDYLIDKKYSDVVNDVIFPIPGTHTFTYRVATPHISGGNPANQEYISKTIDVTIEVLDQPLPQAYYDLIGDNLEGKTWVFDGTANDGGQWFFMSDPANPWGLWWNAGGTGSHPTDVDGKMVFDLDGGANFIYYANEEAEGSEGSFSFNGTYTKLFIGGGVNVLGAKEHGSGNNNGEYTIVELTPDRLVLHTGTNNAGTGWTWVFIPES